MKIDSFAYMPVQEFGNAFSTFIAQNFGAGRYDRIHRGVRSAFVTAVVFSLLVSVLVFIFAKPLILIFVRPDETEIIAVGVAYLRIEGAFYCGIGILFLLYGYYRAIRMPGNVCSCLPFCLLGTRVVLSYWLASIPTIGVTGILVVYSYRLVSSRLSRHCLLPLSQICSLTDLTKIRLRYTFITGFFLSFAAVKSNDKLWTTVFREK